MKNSSRLIFIFMIILSLSACQTFSPEYRLKDHPLVDKVWSVSERTFVSTDSLKSKVLDFDAILLGETHDNARHHQLQGLFIEHVAMHRSPAVTFEMLNQSQQKTINQFQQTHINTNNKTDDFAKAIEWEKSGWPQWSYYRPVFYSTIENNLPIIAANQELQFIRKVIRNGREVLDQNMQDLLIKYQYNETLKSDLEQEILSAHCDMLPEKMLSPMLLGQQVRDLSITQAMITALRGKNAPQGVILIAGSGHTRKDYGVPFYLQKEMPNTHIISIAFIEVQEDALQPEDYAESWGTKTQKAEQLPFDYVWFTAQAIREDQCEKMKAHMKKKNAQ